jgi:hypothetical protein
MALRIDPVKRMVGVCRPTGYSTVLLASLMLLVDAAHLDAGLFG